MFEAYKAKKRVEKEAAELAAFRARDAEVGLPTAVTLGERMAVAARNCQWTIVDDCVQKGCSYNDAIQIKSEKGKECYFAPYADLPKEVYPSSYYPVAPMLVLAIMSKDAAAVAHMVAQGADVNAPMTARYDKISPLALAVHYGVTETVKVLCDNGADLAGDDKPLLYAEKHNLLEIIKIIRAEEAKRAQGQAQLPVRADTPEAREALETVAKLPEAERDWVLASLRDKFPAPAPVAVVPEGLAKDVQVSKPLTLKKQS